MGTVALKEFSHDVWPFIKVGTFQGRQFSTFAGFFFKFPQAQQIKSAP